MFNKRCIYIYVFLPDCFIVLNFTSYFMNIFKNSLIFGRNECVVHLRNGLHAMLKNCPKEPQLLASSFWSRLRLKPIVTWP